MCVQVFVHDVLGEAVPAGLSEQIYSLVGGGRGVTFRELLTLLVLLTRGTREEKVKCELNAQLTTYVKSWAFGISLRKYLVDFKT